MNAKQVIIIAMQMLTAQTRLVHGHVHVKTDIVGMVHLALVCQFLRIILYISKD